MPTPPAVVEGWTLGHRLHPRSPVWLVRSTDGRDGVLKMPTDKKRARNEVAGALKLNGHPGVMPVLAGGYEPRPWFVMPVATTLRDHFGPTAGLVDVVKAGSTVARTLASLHGAGTFHRDIKPANLFCLNGSAVVGDFGIARWPAAPDVTRTGDMIGPSNFLAPEAREYQRGQDAGPGDVWALAQTMWVLARGVTYPPGGPLLLSRRECNLPHLGALTLEALFASATEHLPGMRPPMSEFADELEAWLAEGHPNSTAPGTSIRRLYDFGWRTQDEMVVVRDAEGILGRIGLGPSQDTTGAMQRLARFDLMPGFPSDEAPDLVREWTAPMSGDTRRRFVLSAAQYDNDVTMHGEWQVRDTGGAWRSHWVDQTEYRLRLPSSAIACAGVGDRARAATPS